jgi:transcriptional regulator with XRE-family HTH domain
MPRRKPSQASRAPDATDLLVGRNIRVHRLARRMSQGELAQRAGVTFQQLQKYENGTNRMGASRLKRVADAFDVPVTALFDGARPAKGRGPSPLSLIAAKEPLRLVEAFARIADPEMRRAIVALVQNVAALRR